MVASRKPVLRLPGEGDEAGGGAADSAVYAGKKLAAWEGGKTDKLLGNCRLDERGQKGRVKRQSHGRKSSFYGWMEKRLSLFER